MRLSIISVFVMFLTGCAAAGVPFTSDPMVKLDYAYQLMNTQGRGIAAEKLGKEALVDLEKTNNILGMAEAHTFLGSFYKSRSYREQKDFYNRFNEYDPTAATSIKHFELAAKSFEEIGDYWGVSKVVFSIGNAYETDGDQVNGCLKYKEAAAIYKSDKNVFLGRVHPHNPAFESYEAMVDSFIANSCKSDG